MGKTYKFDRESDLTPAEVRALRHARVRVWSDIEQREVETSMMEMGFATDCSKKRETR